MTDKPFDFEKIAAVKQSVQSFQEQERFDQEQINTPEYYEGLKDTLLRIVSILHSLGIKDYELAHGFVADLLGKEIAGKLPKYKAYDLDIFLKKEDSQKAAEVLQQTGFSLDKISYNDKNEPLIYKLKDQKNQNLVDLFTELTQSPRITVNVEGIEINIESPVSVHHFITSELESDFLSRSVDEKYKRTRKAKNQDRISLLEDAMGKMNMRWKYIDM